MVRASSRKSCLVSFVLFALPYATFLAVLHGKLLHDQQHWANSTVATSLQRSVARTKQNVVDDTSEADRGQQHWSNSTVATSDQGVVDQIVENLTYEVDPDNTDLAKGNRTMTCTTRDGARVTIPRIPDMIIAGTQKGGTTALHAILALHPMISASTRFEPHFFDRHGLIIENRGKLDDERVLCEIRKRYAEAYFQSQMLMANPNVLSFEKTPSYMVGDGIARTIKAVVPWTKIVIVLRNPIDRAFSNYKMISERQPHGPTFDETLAHELQLLKMNDIPIAGDIPFSMENLTPPNRKQRQHWRSRSCLYRGYYANQLRQWLEHFELGKTLLLIRFEELQEQPRVVLKELTDFMGGDPLPDLPDDVLQQNYHPGGQIRMPKEVTMRDATRQYLQRFYQPFNDELADLLGESWRNVWDS